MDEVFASVMARAPARFQSVHIALIGSLFFSASETVDLDSEAFQDLGNGDEAEPASQECVFP